MTNQIQAIKDFGISWNREQRNKEVETKTNTEYQNALKEIGVEIIHHPIKIKHTKVMNIETYINYARGLKC